QVKNIGKTTAPSDATAPIRAQTPVIRSPVIRDVHDPKANMVTPWLKNGTGPKVILLVLAGLLVSLPSGSALLAQTTDPTAETLSQNASPPLTEEPPLTGEPTQAVTQVAAQAQPHDSNWLDLRTKIL